MKPYGNQFNLKKKVSYQSQKNSEKISNFNIKLIHQIFDTINVSFLVLIFTLFFLSFDSQRKWSNTYKTLSKTRAINNNNYLSFILLFITTTLLAPLFEEIIFRGILLPTLSRDFGIILGITVSAFIFALAHLSLGEMPPLFVLGIGLGITRIASGSLLSSVIMHSLWNGLTFLNLFLLRT